MNTKWSVGAVTVAFAWLLAASPCSAQGVPQAGPTDFKLQGVKLQFRSPPGWSGANSSLGGKSPSASKRWMQIEMDFTTELDWTDEVTLKYYALVGQGKDVKLLTGEMTHVNVPRGKNHYSAMFIHPNTLDRYGRGKVEAVAVQLFYQSRLVGQTSEPPAKERWWERYTPVQGQLLPPQMTPWSIVAHERYEQIKSGS